MALPMVTCFKAVHPLKVCIPMDFAPLPIVTCLSEVQFSNVYQPMPVTELGMSIACIAEPEKVPLPRVVSPSGSCTASRLVQFWNAPDSIRSTVVGIITVLSILQL